MRPYRSRYVTLCQQFLALGAVLVALAPATRVVSLDVVGEQPGTPQILHVRPTAHAARVQIHRSHPAVEARRHQHQRAERAAGVNLRSGR